MSKEQFSWSNTQPQTHNQNIYGFCQWCE